jgi:hypothetical protein
MERRHQAVYPGGAMIRIGLAVLAATICFSLVAWAQQGPGPDVVGSTVIGIQGWPVAAQKPKNGDCLFWSSTTQRYHPSGC